jgi:TonB family protein
MIAYVLLLAAATLEVVSEGESPDPYKTCPNGTRVLLTKPCVEREKASSLPTPPPPVFTSPPIRSFQSYPKPRNNPGDWVTTNDYPTRSLQQEEEGVTSFRLEISPDGRVNLCTITSSSGSASLDAATCTNVTRRARFVPALDHDGHPIIGYYSNRVSWLIPAEPSYALQVEFNPTGPQALFGTYIEIDETDYPLEALEKGWKGDADIVLGISTTGSVASCTVKIGSGHELLDNQACKLASQWTFLPARNAAGEAVAGTTTHEFDWNLPDVWKIYQRTGFIPKSRSSDTMNSLVDEAFNHNYTPDGLTG